MRLTLLLQCLATAAGLAASPRRRHTVFMTRDDVDQQYADLARDVSRGFRAWRGPVPSPELAPRDVVRITLEALRRPDDANDHAGPATLLRFARDGFAPAGAPSHDSAMAPLTPARLAPLFDDPQSQYRLLRSRDALVSFADEDGPFLSDEDEAFDELVFEDMLELGGDAPLAKLGWELRRDASDGCWRTSAWHWHDFRDDFRPGIGQEEWPRICG
jgi:hypothetical protein